MKSLARCLACGVFLMAIACSQSLASTVLCASGPTSTLSGTGNWQAVYTCTIPANTLSANQSIRLTADISSYEGLDAQVTLNGVVVFDTAVNPNNYEQAAWDITIMDWNPTTGNFAGDCPEYNVNLGVIYALPCGDTLTGLSWASAQTLTVGFAGTTSSTVRGILFVVEVLN